MRLSTPVLFALSATAASAFSVAKSSIRVPTHLYDATTTATTATDTVNMAVTLAKSELLVTAERLKLENGVLIVDPSSKAQLKQAVEKLELLAEPSTDVGDLVGDWTLLASTASPASNGGSSGSSSPLNFNFDLTKLLSQGPLKDIRNLLNKSLKVQQCIKVNMVGDIDQVDHVLEYQPPDTLSDFLSNLPDAIKSLNINPLQVSKSKVILNHKASIESTIPTIKTKLSLDSIVVNVAGKSQILDPMGADILGINVPLGEFLNAGSFETTYLDSNVRVSRSKVGMVEQLRVFARLEETMDTAEKEGEALFFEDAMSQDFMDDIAVDSEPSDDDDNMEAPSDVEGSS